MISSRMLAAWGWSRLPIGAMFILSLGGCGEEAAPISAPPFIEIAPEILDFGRVPINNSIRKGLILRNQGQSALRIKGVSIQNSDDSFSFFTIPGEIEARDKKELIVQFKATELGVHESTIVIESDADNLPRASVLIRGETVEAEICGDCEMPPSNQCVTDYDLLIHDLTGVCVGGQCRYESRVIPCDGRCVDGACAGNKVPQLSLSITPSSPDTTDELVVTASTSDPDGDQVNLRYEWFRNQQAVSENTDRVSSQRTSKGEEWLVTVTPNDGQVDGPRQTAWVTIGNSPPRVSSATVTPSSGGEQTTFVCSALGVSDADGDQVTLVYRWFVNGSMALAQATIDGASFERGDRIHCDITPRDGEDSGLTVTSATIIIDNQRPSIVSVSIGPTPARESSVIQASVVGWTDADGDRDQSRFAWLVNGATVSSALQIDGALFNRGDNVELVVTPFDGFESGQPVRSNVVPVINTAPGLASVLLSPNPAFTMNTLVARPMGWLDPDGDAPQYEYTWYLNGNALPGTSTDSLSLSQTTPGDRVYVEVVPNDGFETGNSVRSSTVTVANTPPTLASVGINPGSGTETTVFACIPRGWNDVDGDPPGYDYQWFVGGNSRVTTVTIDGTHFNRNDALRCEVRPRDGRGGFGPWVASSTVTVSNTPPSAPTVQITPSNPRASQDLTCSTVTLSSDVDNDNVTYRYGWSNGTSTFSGPVLNASQTSPSETWTCTVTPNDGSDDGPAGQALATIVADCAAGSGLDASCPGVDCLGIQQAGHSQGNGLYWIDPDGTGTNQAFQVHCDMNLHGGGWTLAAVSSDDSQDSWTWNNRNYWDTNTTTFGLLSDLNRDYKSRAHHEVLFTSVMFVHAPSQQWAAYEGVSDGTIDFARFIETVGGPVCLQPSDGFDLSAGTITQTGNLCSTSLYINPQEWDAGLCPSVADHTYGPAWSAVNNDACPFDDVGWVSSLGPMGDSTDPNKLVAEYGGQADRGVGFGWALNLNTGTPGSGENNMRVYVRNLPVTPPSAEAYRIYWTDNGSSKVRRSAPDGTALQDVISSAPNYPLGVAVDPVGDRLYWTEYTGQKIRWSKLDGSNPADLMTTPGSNPAALEIDSVNRKLYWSETVGRAIRRSNLDGTNVETVVPGVEFCVGLAIDSANGHLYWASETNDVIQRSALDGTNIETVVSTDIVKPRGIAVADGYIYWVNRGGANGPPSLRRRLISGGPVSIISTGYSFLQDVEVDPVAGKIYFMDDVISGGGALYKADPDGSNRQTVVTVGLTAPKHLAIWFGGP